MKVVKSGDITRLNRTAHMEFKCKKCNAIIEADEFDPLLEWFGTHEFSFICPCCYRRIRINTKKIKYTDIR
jgi:transcription initiation factor IIE alpha subunit